MYKDRDAERMRQRVDCLVQRTCTYSSVAVTTFRNEAIADPRFGLDVLLPVSAFELLAQLADKHAQILRLMSRLRSPHSCEQRAMGNDLAGIARKVQQQFKFLWRQVDRLALHGDAMRCGIDHEVACFNRRLCALRRAPQVSANAGLQFLDAERLCDVVVGARVERFNFGALMIAN